MLLNASPIEQHRLYQPGSIARSVAFQALQDRLSGLAHRNQAGAINNIGSIAERSSETNQQRILFDSAKEATRFELLNFVLNGGPKWGFRIRQLNDGRVMISRVNSKSPAEKCGLKVNDEILSVNNVTLENKPRSLLINDHYEFDSQQAVDNNGVDRYANRDNVGANGEQQPSSDSYLFQPASNSAELSKLDFAYQLIKHSGLSNKLILTIKRYLSQAYARASVAASNFNADELQSNSLDPLPLPSSKKSFNTGTMHYAYKCCECYCNNDYQCEYFLP